jgi:O-antigen biosynthesis protein WbqP
MYRIFDFILSLLGLILLIPIFILLYLIGLFFVSKPIFLQQRVGRNRRPFTLVKFRTMPIGTVSVASHELQPVALNGWFQFLRKYKLDELLQLFNVLWGDMGFVGPRPCLPNQLELVELRTDRNLFRVRPGITGLAQLRGVDMSTPPLLVEQEEELLNRLTPLLYIQIILKTFTGKGSGDAVKF